MLNPKTLYNPRISNDFNINNDNNFPQNPILNHPLNSSNFNINNMNNMNINNNMNNIKGNMNINNNMNNMNSMNNMNNMNNMNLGNNMNNNAMNNNINNMNNMNNVMNMNNNMSNMNNLNMSTFNNQNNMMQMPNLQINQLNPIKNNNNQVNEINNKLQCIVCSNKAIRPKMCRFCNKFSCSKCITNWLSNNNYCPNCKSKLTKNDITNIPLDEDISNSGSKSRYNIGDVEQRKNRHKSIVIPKGIQRNNAINNMFSNNEDNNMNNQNFCSVHRNKLEFYCFQCDQYYCSNCLIFFGQDVKKHKNHFILQIEKMNDEGIKHIVNEYKKLSGAKSNMDNIIGLCNFKIKENYIKNNQFENYLNIIKDSYLKKLDESFNDLDNILLNLKNQKEKIENSMGSIPNGFNNIVQSNDHVQGDIMFQELKKLNEVDPTLESNINQIAQFQPKIFVENYQSEYLEISIPHGGQYNEGLEIFNRIMNFIPNNKCIFLIKYLQNKVYFSLTIDINLPINSIEFPKFYCYVTIQNQKYGLEFNNLLNQNFPQDVIRLNTGRRNFEQINSNEFDFGQLVFMSGDDKKIKMKIFVMKVYYKS